MKDRESLKDVVTDQLNFLVLGTTATIAFLPLGMLTLSGAWFYLGVAYSLVWVSFVAPSTVAYIVFLSDIWRLYKRERPDLLARILVETAIRIDRPQDARKHKIHWFIDLSCRANPLTTLFLALFSQALAWRTELVREMWQEARQAIVPKKAKPVLLPESSNTAEFGAELVEPLVRRERWSGPLAHA